MTVGTGARSWIDDLIRRVVWLMGIFALAPGMAAYAQSSENVISTAAVLQRLDALEHQNGELRAEVIQLRQQVDANSRSSQVTQANPGAAAAGGEYSVRGWGSPVQVGFRTGWSESPYKMPGGFFYGVNLDDLLLTEEDGISYGHVTGEMMVGVILGNHAVTIANLASQLGVTRAASTSLLTLELQPTLQYHADLVRMGLPRFNFVDPYILAGPGIWISMLTTPVVVKGSIPGNSAIVIRTPTYKPAESSASVPLCALASCSISRRRKDCSTKARSARSGASMISQMARASTNTRVRLPSASEASVTVS